MLLIIGISVSGELVAFTLHKPNTPTHPQPPHVRAHVPLSSRTHPTFFSTFFSFNSSADNRSKKNINPRLARHPPPSTQPPSSRLSLSASPRPEGPAVLLEQMTRGPDAFVEKARGRRGARLSYYVRHMINRAITQQHQYKRQNNEGYHRTSILI